MAKPTKTTESAAKSSESAPAKKPRGRPPLPPEQRKQRTKGEVIHLYFTKGSLIEQALGRAIALRAQHGIAGSKQARTALKEWVPIARGGAMDAFRVQNLKPTLDRLIPGWLADAGGESYAPDILHVYENVAADPDANGGPSDKEIFAFLDELFNSVGVSKSHSLKAAMSLHLMRVLNSPMKPQKA
jgi:hypothetical protein